MISELLLWVAVESEYLSPEDVEQMLENMEAIGHAEVVGVHPETGEKIYALTKEGEEFARLKLGKHVH